MLQIAQTTKFNGKWIEKLKEKDGLQSGYL
jgi:hypothetical protein